MAKIPKRSSSEWFVLKDFKEAYWYGNDGSGKKKLLGQDKGQKNMITQFIGTLNSGVEPLIPFDQIVAVTRASILAIKSLQNKQALDI